MTRARARRWHNSLLNALKAAHCRILISRRTKSSIHPFGHILSQWTVLPYLSYIQLKKNTSDFSAVRHLAPSETTVRLWHLLDSCFKTQASSMHYDQQSTRHGPNVFSILKGCRARAPAVCAITSLWSALPLQTWQFGFPQPSFPPNTNLTASEEALRGASHYITTHILMNISICIIHACWWEHTLCCVTKCNVRINVRPVDKVQR